AAPYRAVDGLQVTAIDRELVGQIGRAELRIALGVIAVTGDARGGENLLAGLDSPAVDVLRVRARQRIDERGHFQDVVSRQHLVTPERRHLRHTGVLVHGVDADADRIEDVFRLAAPEPG